MRTHTALLSTVALVTGFSVQLATAADLLVKRPLPPAPVVVSRWDGAFVSFSGGGTYTKADESLQQTGTASEVTTQNDVGFTRIDTFITPFNNSDSQQQTNNRAGGAVFTFATGYNLVWSNWLVGIQSEVSLNRNNIRLQGTRQNSSTTTGQSVTNGVADNPFSVTSTSSNNEFSDLNHKWTISEMGRIGFLLRPDILVYALGGWSWAGFTWNSPSADQGDTASFTLNGPTWGVGLEKDFGSFHGFVQYKGVSYRNKDVDFSRPNTNTNTFTQGTFTRIDTNTTTDTATRRFSANYAEITAGITIPLNNFR